MSYARFLILAHCPILEVAIRQSPIKPWEGNAYCSVTISLWLIGTETACELIETTLGLWGQSLEAPSHYLHSSHIDLSLKLQVWWLNEVWTKPAEDYINWLQLISNIRLWMTWSLSLNIPDFCYLNVVKWQFHSLPLPREQHQFSSQIQNGRFKINGTAERKTVPLNSLWLPDVRAEQTTQNSTAGLGFWLSMVLDGISGVAAVQTSQKLSPYFFARNICTLWKFGTECTCCCNELFTRNY